MRIESENENRDESGISGSSLADDIKNAEDAPKEPVTVKTVLHWLRKWWMIPVYVVIAVLLVIFIAGGDDDDLYKAHFKAENVVTIGETDYRLLTRDEQGHYIGSFVSDKLVGVKNKKIATMRSYILYVSVFYSVTGDDDYDYVMDGKNSVYVRDDLYESVKPYYDNEENIVTYKMTDKNKDMNSMTELDSGKVAVLYEMFSENEKRKESGEETEEVKFTDPLISENYATRREIYGYYSNGLFCRAKLELFRDKENNLYLTTEMIDSKDNKEDGVTALKGIRLDPGTEEYFRGIW